MPLKRLHVPADDNHFYSAFSLGFLLPILNDDEKLENALKCLFGKLSISQISPLYDELKRYSQEAYPTLLQEFINKKLRPTVAQYIRDTCRTQSQYISIFNSNDAELLAASDAIEQGSPLFERIAIKALERMSNTRVQVDSLLNNINISEDDALTRGKTVIYLTVIDNVYQYLIDPASLSEILRNKLFPFSGSTQIVEPVVFKRAKLKEVLLKTLSTTPEHLSMISHHVPRQSVVRDVYSECPTDLRDYVRFEPLRETQIMRRDMNTVNLTTAYDLCLKSESDGVIMINRLYIDIESSGFRYTARNPNRIDEIIPEAEDRFITFESLGLLSTNNITLENLKVCLPKILEITSNRGHTKIDDARMNILATRAITVGLNFGGSSVAGLSVMGGFYAWGELEIGRGLGYALASSSLGLAFGGVTMGLTLIGTLYGMGFAVAYELALDKASLLLNQGKFKEAADELDKEFNRYDINQLARWWFLSKQHYAVAHFLRAVCADMEDEGNIAYVHYEQACENAKSAKKTLAYLASQLQLLKLLRNSSIQLPPTITNRDEEIDKRLLELGRDYVDGFADAYWSLHNSMIKTAERFTTLNVLDARDIKIANSFLISDGFFILKQFAGGYGPFLSLFGEFFQGTMLTFFDHMNPNYLDENTKVQLLKDSTDRESFVVEFPNKINAILASAKFRSCAKLLGDFKLKHDGLIKNNSTIQSSIIIIETFILNFYVLSIDGKIITLEDCYDISQLLGIENQCVETLLEKIKFSIDFMSELNREFDLTFETVDQWLDAILVTPGTMANIISKTGDTMLHALAKLPIGETEAMTKRVQDAAIQLKALRHKPNYDNKTPLEALHLIDPCLIKDKLLPDIIMGECLFISVATTEDLKRVSPESPFLGVYVRLSDDDDEGIFYLTDKTDEWIKLTKKQLTAFDEEFPAVEQLTLLSKADLTKILLITGHSHEGSVWKLHIEGDRIDMDSQIKTEMLARFRLENTATVTVRNQIRMLPDPLDSEIREASSVNVTPPVGESPRERSSSIVKGVQKTLQTGVTNMTASITQTFYGSKTTQSLQEHHNEKSKTVNLG